MRLGVELALLQLGQRKLAGFFSISVRAVELLCRQGSAAQPRYRFDHFRRHATTGFIFFDQSFAGGEIIGSDSRAYFTHDVLRAEGRRCDERKQSELAIHCWILSVWSSR